MRKFHTYGFYRNCVALMCAVASFVSCNGIDPLPPSLSDEGNDYAVVLNVSPDGLTKISHDGYDLAWERTDQIQLTAVTDGIEVSDTVGTSVLKLFEYIDEDPSKASFTGFVTLRSEPRDCYFTHPVGETVTVDAVKGTVKALYTSQDGTHKPFLYGKSEYNESGMDVTLTHLGAVLEITVETPGVTHISLVGNKIESLSPIIINPEDGTVTEPDEAVHQITVPVQAEGKTYIFVPPVNFEKGFTLVCSDGTQSNYFMKSYSDSATGGYDFSKKRGVKIPITVSGEFVQFAVAASDFNIVHSRNGSGLLTGTTVSFKMSKSGSPDKLIEGWGGTLVDAKGNVVRTFDSTDPLTTPQSVTMTVTDNNIFLKEGEYTFTPYYILYGKKVSLDKEDQVKKKTISGPGIVLNIGGNTSYDKYKAGNSAGANSHANTLLSGLNVSTNVAADVISQFSYSLVGDDNTVIDVGNPDIGVASSSTIATFGDKTCSKFQGYTMSARIEVGNISVDAQRVFHITGLPYEGVFTSNPTEWSPGWSFNGSIKYINPRVQYNGDGAVRSPSFYIPYGNGINVKTSLDACLAATMKDNRRVYIKSCSSSEGSADFSGSYVEAHYKVIHSSDNYKDCGDKFTLTTDTPAMLYSKEKPGAYNTSLYKVKIVYTN